MQFHQGHQEQAHQILPIYTQLSDIYADIQGELCSKQSTLLNKLKNNFLTLYSDLLPSHFIIINHVISLSNFSFTKNFTCQQIKIALQNGIILLVKQTYLGDKIFINGLCEKQLIYEGKGSIIDEEAGGFKSKQIKNNQLKKDIQKIIHLANDSLSLNKLYGGTILFYSNISENAQYHREKVLLSIFISTLIINQQLNHTGIHEIYQKLYNSYLFNPDFLQSQFMPFNKSQFLIEKNNTNELSNTYNKTIQSLKIDNKEKLLFFDMNLNSQQIQNYKMKHIQLLQSLQKLQQNESKNISQFIEDKIHKLQGNKLSVSDFINILNKEIYSNQNINMSLISKQLENEIKQISKLVGKQLQDCILIDGYLMFCMRSYEIHQKIRILRKYINNKLSQQNPQLVTKRYNKTVGVDKLIFSSSPSLSIAILNPENQMWFK